MRNATFSAPAVQMNRGGAATVGVLPYLDISAFYSQRSMDGVVEDGEMR